MDHGQPNGAARPVRRGRGTALLGVAAGVTVVVSAALLVIGVVRTSDARFAASTGSEGLLGAGVIELDLTSSRATLALDVTGLYPGLPVSSCVEVDYTGTTPARLRFLGSVNGGDGLERFLELRLTVAPGPCADPAATSTGGAPVFAGSLAEVVDGPSARGTAVEIDPSIEPGERLALTVEVVVVDDDGAQGRSTDVDFVIEARP